ncbi:hypothetical protein [Saccharopolyspora taberi]|uniref:Secreted protein n=1 Tax=Saccharopolyspora taberi TaxID=60895 RepID=A0ABN3VKF1_9PSEU
MIRKIAVVLSSAAALVCLSGGIAAADPVKDLTGGLPIVGSLLGGQGQ